MRFCKGKWHYMGQTYATLREALAAVWPEAAGQKKAAPVLEHRSGRAENVLKNTVSASNYTGNGGHLQV